MRRCRALHLRRVRAAQQRHLRAGPYTAARTLAHPDEANITESSGVAAESRRRTHTDSGDGRITTRMSIIVSRATASRVRRARVAGPQPPARRRASTPTAVQLMPRERLLQMLDAEDAAAFEDHYFTCHGSLEIVEKTDAFIVSLPNRQGGRPSKK